MKKVVFSILFSVSSLILSNNSAVASDDNEMSNNSNIGSMPINSNNVNQIFNFIQFGCLTSYKEQVNNLPSNDFEEYLQVPSGKTIPSNLKMYLKKSQIVTKTQEIEKMFLRFKNKARNKKKIFKLHSPYQYKVLVNQKYITPRVSASKRRILIQWPLTAQNIFSESHNYANKSFANARVSSSNKMKNGNNHLRSEVILQRSIYCER